MIAYRCPDPTVGCQHYFVCTNISYNACVWCGKVEGDDDRIED